MIVRVDTGTAIQDASKGCQKWIDRKRKSRCSNRDIFLIYFEKDEYREKERKKEIGREI